ncbi:MAG: hypothetical protein JSS95_07000 [Acidobacteria bacterium]|nr:hypothetical protein [Acidobacteriota bacterium]
MHITTFSRFEWDGKRYVEVYSEGYAFNGLVDLCCGASSQQTQTYNQQTQLSQQIMQQGQQVFGDSSKVFSDLVSSLAPTVSAGPNQEGFSAAEKSALQSQAITNAGVAYKNAKAATGNAIAAQGGGNTGTVSGANLGIEAKLAASASQNTADQLNQINLNDYQQGRENYNNAVNDLAGTTNVFNPATNVDNSATGALEGQAKTANDIASQNNSWVQAVSGALGNLGGVAVDGFMNNLGRSSKSSTTSSANG